MLKTCLLSNGNIQELVEICVFPGGLLLVGPVLRVTLWPPKLTKAEK